MNAFPREGCGVIAVIRGKPTWIPCTNIASASDEFKIDPNEWNQIIKTADIIAIVHSHPSDDPTPSETDIRNCNTLGIPYYIYGIPSMKEYILEPEVKDDFIGRIYEFGVKDCFELARDFYKKNNIKIPPREGEWQSRWWKHGLNYFSPLQLDNWGFKLVSEPKRGDLVLFQINAPVDNHCGIYLGNDVILHHAENRLSCRENLYPTWIKFKTTTWRYEQKITF